METCYIAKQDLNRAMISRKHTISSVINQLTLYFSVFSLFLLLLLGYFFLEMLQQRDETVFHTHVQQIASDISYTASLQGTRNLGSDELAAYLAAVGNLGSYYEITDAENNIISRTGNNSGDFQVVIDVENTGWKLLSRQDMPSVPALLMTKMPLYVVSLSFILINTVLFILGRRVVSLFRAEFRQMSKAVKIELDNPHTTPVASNILVREFFDLYKQLIQSISEGRKAKAFINDEAIRDPFTLLLNRNRFNECQHKFYNLASRQIGITMVMLDIDDLDEINKKLGREKGDEVIKGVSDILRGALRKSDDSFYLGDGHFAIGMIEAEPNEVFKWYEFLTKRFDVLEQSLKISEKSGLELSISAAAARVSKADESLEDTMKRCEEVLQSVKQQSQGIIVMAKDPVIEFPEQRSRHKVANENRFQD